MISFSQETPFHILPLHQTGGRSVHGHAEWHREQRNGVRLPMLTRWLLKYASRRKKMVYDLMDTGCAEDGEPSYSAEDIPAERLSPVSLLSNHLCSAMSL